MFAIDSFAHFQRLYDVVKHLLLFMVVLPLFYMIVLAVDLLKVRVPLLVILDCYNLFVFNFLLLLSLSEIVLN